MRSVKGSNLGLLANFMLVLVWDMVTAVYLANFILVLCGIRSVKGSTLGILAKFILFLCGIRSLRSPSKVRTSYSVGYGHRGLLAKIPYYFDVVLVWNTVEGVSQTAVSYKFHTSFSVGYGQSRGQTAVT